jgi:hypothetical protein
MAATASAPQMADAGIARECGACTACCIVPGIDTREIQKQTGAACRHCSASGCANYETRPKACREFTCAWLEGVLPDDWRPERSGVLAQGVTIGLRPGLSLMLIADALKTVRQPWFVDFVFAQLQLGMPLLLALPGPAGTRSAKHFLNAEMGQAATPEQVRQVLRRSVVAMLASEFEPLVLLNSGNDVSTP